MKYRNTILLAGILVGLAATKSYAQNVIRIRTDAITTEGEDNRNVMIHITKEGEGYLVRVEKTENGGEPEVFEKRYEEHGAWREDEAFQEFTGQKLQIHEEGEFAFATKADGDEHPIKIIVEREGDAGENNHTFVYRVHTDDDEGAAVVLEAHNVIIKRLSDGEITEVVLTDELFEKAGLQNGKPFADDDLKVYPNPSSGAFNVDLSNDINEPLTIRVVDLQGREVFSKTFDKTGAELNAQIYLQDQESGIYVLQAIQGEHVSTHKVIVE